MHPHIEAEARQQIGERIRRASEASRSARPAAYRRHRLAARLRTLADVLDR